MNIVPHSTNTVASMLWPLKADHRRIAPPEGVSECRVTCRSAGKKHSRTTRQRERKRERERERGCHLNPHPFRPNRVGWRRLHTPQGVSSRARLGWQTGGPVDRCAALCVPLTTPDQLCSNVVRVVPATYARRGKTPQLAAHVRGECVWLSVAGLRPS